MIAYTIQDSAGAASSSSIVWSAFLGAFFPFLFLVLWDRVQKRAERRKKAVNALVELEHVANRTLAVADKNAYGLRRAIERGETDWGPGAFAFTVLDIRELAGVPARVLLDLLSADLINEGFLLDLQVGTINTDAKKFERMYHEMMSSTDGQRLSPEQLKEFKSRHQQSLLLMRELETAYIGIMEECVDLCATSKVVYKKTRGRFPIVKGLNAMTVAKWRPEVRDERERMIEQIRQTRSKPTAYERGLTAPRPFWEESDERAKGAK